MVTGILRSPGGVARACRPLLCLLALLCASCAAPRGDGARVLVSAPGPLPISVQFEAVADGDLVLLVSGSAWTDTRDRRIGVEVLLDEAPVGEAFVHANEARTHMALVAKPLVVPAGAGKHVLELRRLNADTNSDFADRFEVLALRP